MKKTLILTILFIGLSGIIEAQLKLHKWKDSHYDKYTCESFQKLDIIKQKIDPKNIDYKLFKAAIFYRTNIERVKHKKDRFKHSVALEKAAHGHSKNMVKLDFYSHTSPVKGKENMSLRLESVGIKNVYSAENIYDTYEKDPTYWSFASGLVEGWMDSKGHKRNILNSNYKYLGCGVYYYINKEWKQYFWVKSTQNFSSKDAE